MPCYRAVASARLHTAVEFRSFLKLFKKNPLCIAMRFFSNLEAPREARCHAMVARYANDCSSTSSFIFLGRRDDKSATFADIKKSNV